LFAGSYENNPASGVSPSRTAWIIDGPSGTGGNTASNRILLGWNSGGAASYNGELFMTGPAVGQNNVAANTAWSVVTGVYNGASARLRANGQQVATGNSGSNSINVLTLGFCAPTGQSFNGPFGSLLIYNRALNDTELAAVEGYLAWTWGSQSALPYTHPYAASFPGFGSQTLPTDADALAYLSAVATADGGTGVEVGVANAINNFVTGCKADGIWSSIKASCILMGARTLPGALTPLVGSGPTNVNNNFVSGDYSRKTGLVGNATNKSLNTNRSDAADLKDSQHVAVYVTTAHTSTGNPTAGQYPIYIGSAHGSDGMTGIVRNISSGGVQSSITYFRSRSQNVAQLSNSADSTGFIGINRSESANFVYRIAGATSANQPVASLTPTSTNQFVLGIPNNVSFSNGRVAFYSIGESLPLATLDSRVSALYTAIGAAIP
jgi:hypothetical protein